MHEGIYISKADYQFREALKAASDYCGDVNLKLQDGTSLDGFLFHSSDDGHLEVFPKNSPRKARIRAEDLHSLTFFEVNQSQGDQWKAWLQKQPDFNKMN